MVPDILVSLQLLAMDDVLVSPALMIRAFSIEGILRISTQSSGNKYPSKISVFALMAYVHT